MEIGDRLIHSKNILFLLAGAAIMMVLFAGIFISGSEAKPAEKVAKTKITEITLESETARLRIQRNGVVEIHSGDQAFFQYWDNDRIERLFQLIEQQDFGGFDSRLKPGESGYLLTLTTESGVITVAIPIDSTFIPPVVEELIEILAEVEEQAALGEDTPAVNLLFASPSPSVAPLPSPSPSPSPLPLVPSPSPSPSPFFGGGSLGNGGVAPQELFVCEYTGTTSKTRLLSETWCDLAD